MTPTATPHGCAAALGRSSNRGFSLIELMVVLVIIGILAGVVGFNLVGAGERARIQATKTQMSACASGVTLYRSHYAEFPPDGEAGMQALVDENLVEPGAIIDTWDQPMFFTSQSEVADWEIWSSGPDREWQTEDDIVHRPGGQG
ncbi:MAG: prepilin-type N-terminal cleavage/methylation domain-containing protein [Planctomycetota bacterium]